MEGDPFPFRVAGSDRKTAGCKQTTGPFSVHPAAHRAERTVSMSALHKWSRPVICPLCSAQQRISGQIPCRVKTDPAHVKGALHCSYNMEICQNAHTLNCTMKRFIPWSTEFLTLESLSLSYKLSFESTTKRLINLLTHAQSHKVPSSP